MKLLKIAMDWATALNENQLQTLKEQTSMISQKVSLIWRLLMFLILALKPFNMET